MRNFRKPLLIALLAAAILTLLLVWRVPEEGPDGPLTLERVTSVLKKGMTWSNVRARLGQAQPTGYARFRPAYPVHDSQGRLTGSVILDFDGEGAAGDIERFRLTSWEFHAASDGDGSDVRKATYTIVQTRAKISRVNVLSGGQRFPVKLYTERNSPPLDWKDMRPTRLLEKLQTVDAEVYSVWGTANPSSHWNEETDVPMLLDLLDSTTPCASVKSVGCSAMALRKSTIGHEAAYLIEGFRRGRYPLGSSHLYKPDRAELRRWWAEHEAARKGT